MGLTGFVKAANTDVSTLENVIYISPFTATAGSQMNISIQMKNSVSIRGFQFDLYLPEGVTVVTNSNGRIKSSLTATRLETNDEHTLTVRTQDNGAIRFLCGSQYDESFTGSDGEIATLAIKIAAGVSVGDYSIKLKNIKLTETDISMFYETDLVESTIYIGEPADTRTVLDETSTVAPAAATGVDVRVKRSIKADEWNTLCLPFAMSEAQVKEAFGEDVQLRDFAGYEVTEDEDENVVGITVNFSSLTKIEANHPCLIRVSSAISEFTVDGVDINPEEEPVVAAVKRTRKAWSELVGTYVAGTEVPEKTLFLSGNEFWYSAGATRMKGFRAYFDFYDVLTEVDENYANVRFVFSEGEATGVKGVREGIADRTMQEGVYTLQGVKVEGTKALPKGVYIVNGKKVRIDN